MSDSASGGPGALDGPDGPDTRPGPPARPYVRGRDAEPYEEPPRPTNLGRAFPGTRPDGGGRGVFEPGLPADSAPPTRGPEATAPEKDPPTVFRGLSIPPERAARAAAAQAEAAPDADSDAISDSDGVTLPKREKPAGPAPETPLPVSDRPRRAPAPAQDAAAEGALRQSFAELAAASPDTAAEPADGGGTDLAIPGQHGQSGYAQGALDPYDPSAAGSRADAPALLLSSIVDLREMWLPLLSASAARSITLLGTENGATTTLLADLLRSGGGGRLLVVDPNPGRLPASGRGLDVQVVREHGAAGLEDHTPTDAYVIDGDANFASVTAALGAVDDAVHAFDRALFPLVLVHDVGWPSGRRDRYTAPERLADVDVQPHSWDAGVTLQQPGAIPGRGLRGDGAYAWALAEGGARNGVRTAVEEFVATNPDLRFFTIAPVFGLGIVIDRRAPYAPRIAELLAPWVSNPLLTRLERNRLDLYLRVVAQRDEAMATAALHHQELTRLDDERARLIAIDIEKSDRIAELERALAAERALTAEALAARLEEPRLVAAVRTADSKVRSRLRRGPSRLDQARARFEEEERRRREQLAEPGEDHRGPALAALPAAGGGQTGPGAALPPGPGAAGSPVADPPVRARPPLPLAAGPVRARPAGGAEHGDVLAGGPGEGTPSGLWTPTRTSGTPTGPAGTGPAPAGQASSGYVRPYHSRRTAPPTPPSTGAVLLTPEPEPADGHSTPSLGYRFNAAGAPGSSTPPAGSLFVPPPIQPGQPIPAGQSIPPGSAVQPAAPAAPMDSPTGEQPLFDPSAQRRRGLLGAERREPRHRAPRQGRRPDR